MAIAYGGNPPQHVAFYTVGQTVPTRTLTYNGCCFWQILFDPQGDLVMVDGSKIDFYAAGSTTPFKTLPAQGGFSLAMSAQGDFAVGGYNMGSTVAVYPGGSASAIYRVPGQPAFQALAFSPAGELAVPQSNGMVQTFARGSTTPNRTLPLNAIAPSGVNVAKVAYDQNGNLAVTSYPATSIGVYASGATIPAYTISGFNGVQSFVFDNTNRLVVGDGVSINSSIKIFAAGSATLVRTLSNNNPSAIAVDTQGDIAFAGQQNPSGVYLGNGSAVTINGLDRAFSVTITP
jgi:hypothetical protein